MIRLLLILLVIGFCSFSFGQVYTEDFSTESIGAVSGTALGTPGGTWSVTTTPPGTFSVQNPYFLGNFFFVNDALTEGVWQSNVITLPSPQVVTITVDLTTAFTNATDYIRVYYKVDGGPEILFAELLGQLANATTTGSAYVAGNTLQIVMRGRDTQTGTLFGAPLGFSMDNLIITSVPAVYSRKNSTWTDVTTGNSTWSAVAIGGTSCNCVPTATQVAVIGGGFTVTLPSNQSVGGVIVNNTGVFQFNTSGAALTVLEGLFRVQNGGTVNSSSGAITGEQIIFNANVPGANFQVDAGGSAAFQDLVFSAGATALHYINGSGSINISNDILINASNATITNNATTLNASRLVFGQTGTISNSSFVNNGTASFTGNLGANDAVDDNNGIVNSGSLSFSGVDALFSGSGAGADFRIDNSGTINQTGTFTDIPANTNAANSINNLAGGTWNYSGTGPYTNLRLFANNPTNTFVYNFAGAQQIITPVAGNGYNNLTLTSSVAGAKTALGSFSISGNYNRTASATFANGGFTVTLNGNSTQTISAVGGETFSGLTINNTSGITPAITTNSNVTVSGVLTMTAGNVNLAGNIFSISSATTGSLVHGLTSTSGWMYGGTVSRAFSATPAIAIGNVDGFLPIGTSTNFRPFFFGKTGTGGSSGTIALTHTDPGTLATTGLSINDGGTNIIIRDPMFWGSTLTGGAGATFGIRYGGTGLGTVTNLSHVRSMLFSSVVGTHVTATTVSLTDPRVERSTLTSAQMTNNFYVGSTNLASPLPVELLSFKATNESGEVILSWATASELNNDFFTIQRSATGEKFDDLLKVEGQGTVNKRTDYQIMDTNPLNGLSYYRLMQTDFDGTFTYSKVVSVENATSALRFSLYPNPTINKQFNIALTGADPSSQIPLRIINMQGAVVYESTWASDERGAISEKVDLNHIANGVYVVIINSRTGLQKRLVLD